MREIGQLTNSDLDDFITITANAYPGIKLVGEVERQRFRERNQRMNAEPTIHLYGLFDENRLLGVMRFYDFTMKLLSTRTLVGGVGSVAVDLLHKKEKVARDMILFFLRHYRAQGACMTALYPFRPDFYKRMGFGYGAKMNQYRLRPDSLPQGATKEKVVFLDKGDAEALNACYNRFMDKTNGLMELSGYALEAMFSDPAWQIVGYREDGQIRGYLHFRFQPGKAGHFLDNDMIVRTFVYETPQALHQLLAFLRSQADQVGHIVFNTQDATFHHLLSDPRSDTSNLLSPVYHESNTQGVGIMYRVISVPRLFAVLGEHDFGGQSCRLHLTVLDNFLPENNGTCFVHFQDGRAQLASGGEYEVAVSLGVAEFSSLVVGAISFRQLHRYGLVQISDQVYVETVHQLFQVAERPLCMTTF